ncbi:hypothetical protein CR970_01310 [Candidatus Saccharibacteria bacterium]|nr:MAG: hypothetical protein CR970_01310 [Candidatus Saccharibacteria bacterium]
MNWLNENRVLTIGIVLVLGFAGFAIAHRGSKSDTPAAPEAAVSQRHDYKTINPESTMRRGNPDANVSFIQYSDFLCPSCSYISTQIMPEIDKKYIQTDQIEYEFRPMAFIADGSLYSGMGAYCAVEQDKFWTYHDAIYGFVANSVFNERLDPKTDIILTAGIVKAIAAQIGLNADEFDTCLDSNKYLSTINDVTQAAKTDGVTSTPYLLVNGREVTGNPSLQTIDAMIKAAL